MTKQHCHVRMPRLVGFLIVGFVVLLSLPTPPMTAAAQEADKAVTLNIEHTRPTDIIEAQSKTSNGNTTVSGLVRHPGEPGRDEIFGHVVAEYRTASGELKQIEVPLILEEGGESGRDAKFSFDIPSTADKPTTVTLRYVERRL